MLTLAAHDASPDRRRLGPLGDPDEHVVVDAGDPWGEAGRAARRLATTVYGRVGFLDAGPGGYASDGDGLLVDRWMATSTVFAARWNGRVVGASRLIAPIDGCLPASCAATSCAGACRTETSRSGGAGGTVPARTEGSQRGGRAAGGILEVSMLVSDGTLAGASTVALIRAMWQHALRHDTADFVALLERPLLVYLTRFLRTDWEVVGPPHHDATGTTLPVRFDVQRPGRRIPASLWRYLTDGLTAAEVPGGDGVPPFPPAAGGA